MLKIKKNRLISIILNISISIILYIYILTNWNNTDFSTTWSKDISIIVMILFVYQLTILKLNKYDYKNFFFWFIPLNYLFLYLRIILNDLSLDINIFWKLFESYSSLASYRSALFSIAYIQILFTGIIMIEQEKLQVENFKFRKKQINSDKCQKFIGIFLLIISMPFKIIYDYIVISAQSSNGSYIAVPEISGVIVALSALPVVALIFIVICEEINKRKTIILLGAYFLYCGIIMVFAGDRRQLVISLIVCILAFMEKYRVSIKGPKLFKYIILSIILLIILAAVREGRSNVIESFDDFKVALNNIKESNILYETLAEFGITFFSIVGAVEFYPSIYSFALGKTYIASILVVIPGFAKVFPSIFEFSSISKNIKNINNQGLGGSIPQDLYANFSIYGLLISFVIGIILALVMRRRKNSTGMDTIKYYILFYFLINLVRAGFFEITRNIFFAYILIYILKKLYIVMVRRKKVMINS